MAFQTTTVTRRKKQEVEQAISDLQKRGFELVAPMKELFSDGKQFKRDSHNRRIFTGNTSRSCWIAKLRREIE